MVSFSSPSPMLTDRQDAPVVRVLHLVQEVVQLILVPDWSVDLPAVQVVADVREVLVPLHGNVPHRVPDVLVTTSTSTTSTTVNHHSRQTTGDAQYSPPRLRSPGRTHPPSPPSVPPASVHEIKPGSLTVFGRPQMMMVFLNRTC